MAFKIQKKNIFTQSQDSQVWLINHIGPDKQTLLLCERDGRLCSVAVPVTEIDVAKYCNTNVSFAFGPHTILQKDCWKLTSSISHAFSRKISPTIQTLISNATSITRPMRQPATSSAAGLFRDDRRTVMMPVNESLIKRLTRSVFEHSLVEALTEATAYENRETNVLYVLSAANRVRIFFKPHLKDQGMNSGQICSNTGLES